jgi:hypothetical protein
MDDICPICYENFEYNDITILKCGHKFHDQCILETYKNNRDNIKNIYIRCCPYCRKDGGYLPLKPNLFPLKKIHNEWNIINNEMIKNNNKNINDLIYPYLNKEVCYAIIKTGKNKGTQCLKKKYGNLNYCCLHTKYNK